MATKSNFNHLREIINKSILSEEDREEAIDFIDAAETSFLEKCDKINSLQENVNELESALENEEPENSDFVGLDTINWSLDQGNLKIQMQVETFIEQLKKENCVAIHQYK